MKTTTLTAVAIATLALAAPTAVHASTSSSLPHAASRATGLPHHWTPRNKYAKKHRKTSAKHRKRTLAQASWVYAGTAGSAGAVTATTPISALDVNYGYGTLLLVMNSTGPTVSRSPATTGAQDVEIYYSLQVWDGIQWVQQTAQRSYGRVGAGYSNVRLPALVQYPKAYRGYTRVVEMITWYVGGTSTMLGSTLITPHLASDQVCVTPLRPCASYPGYMRLGSLSGGW
jgi:hypothetical protein